MRFPFLAILGQGIVVLCKQLETWLRKRLVQRTTNCSTRRRQPGGIGLKPPGGATD